MLRCTPDKRETSDVICMELSKILASLTKQASQDELLQDLAYMRREESATSLQVPEKISIHEDTRDWAAERLHTPTGSGGDTSLMMLPGSQKSRQVNVDTREHSQDHTSSARIRRDSKTPTANTFAATSLPGTKFQPTKEVSAPKHSEASSRSVTGSLVPNEPPSTTKTDKTKRRISQKSKKWIKSPMNYVIRMFK